MKVFIINEYKKEFVNYKPVGKGSDIVQFFFENLSKFDNQISHNIKMSNEVVK